MNSQAEREVPASAPKPLASWYAQGLSDGLGDRLLMFDNSGAPSLELLRFHQEFAQVPGFEQALRDQVHRLSEFRHPAFARIRSVQRLEPDDDLALISNCTAGKRLSDVLHHTRGPEFAAALIRQLAPALALFQQHGAGISHGVLSPDRVVVSPEGRLTIVEHVVGPAIDKLDLSAAQLAAIGITVPPAADGTEARLGVATDWYQLGLVAVSVLLGRPVAPSDVPQLEALLDRLSDSAGPDSTPVSPFMRQWLHRALQISGAPIESGADAHALLDELLKKESPRDSRRIEPLRCVEAAPSQPPTTLETAPSEPVPAPRSDAVADILSDRAVASPAIELFPSESVGGPAPEPIPFTRVEPAPMRKRTNETSILDIPPPPPARQPPPPGRVLFAQGASASIDQGTSAKHRLLDFQRGAALYETPAAARPHPETARRRAIPTSMFAALALIAVVEAGVIVWQARMLWLAPRPAIAVESAAAGENVVLTSRSTTSAPLQLTVAPDLRWARVTSPSSDGFLGGKVKEGTAGTIRISSPIELKVFEDSRRLGSVPGADIKVPPGRHQIELVNQAFGYRLLQTVEVKAGQTVSVHVAPPHGWVTVDAAPWAEVSIDGQAAGRTPFGPLPLAPGEHQVTFQHPSGLTDRQRVTIKADTTTRVTGVLRR
jgi:PEGA domain